MGSAPCCAAPRSMAPCSTAARSTATTTSWPPGCDLTSSSAARRYLHAAKKTAQRAEKVAALNPAPQHLPALSTLAVQKDAAFDVALDDMQQGRFKVQRQQQKKHAPGGLTKSIRACHPGLWQQLYRKSTT
jgi:hypothetical protein